MVRTQYGPWFQKEQDPRRSGGLPFGGVNRWEGGKSHPNTGDVRVVEHEKTPTRR